MVSGADDPSPEVAARRRMDSDARRRHILDCALRLFPSRGRDAVADALARFNAFISSSTRLKAERGGDRRFLPDAMPRPGNGFLPTRALAAAAEAARPALRIAGTAGIEAASDPLDGRMTAEGRMIGRMLGLPDGSVVLPDRDACRRMARAVAGV